MDVNVVYELRKLRSVRNTNDDPTQPLRGQMLRRLLRGPLPCQHLLQVLSGIKISGYWNDQEEPYKCLFSTPSAGPTATLTCAQKVKSLCGKERCIPSVRKLRVRLTLLALLIFSV
jgi:hypothetical protein